MGVIFSGALWGAALGVVGLLVWLGLILFCDKHIRSGLEITRFKEEGAWSPLMRRAAVSVASDPRPWVLVYRPPFRGPRVVCSEGFLSKLTIQVTDPFVDEALARLDSAALSLRTLTASLGTSLLGRKSVGWARAFGLVESFPGLSTEGPVRGRSVWNFLLFVVVYAGIRFIDVLTGTSVLSGRQALTFSARAIFKELGSYA